MTKTVYDPFGTAIVLVNSLAQIIVVPESTVCIDATEVIMKPVMMFETKDGVEKIYVRTVDWDNLVLVSAKKAGENFISDNYLLNPPIEHIFELMKSCRQIK
ncbi:hypothetical protein [Niastella sp. OAS944]|uniref:hypothetical protein n=1 Tax=Niastella sp. OAS944 TaxID=2664089 RepID=UPI00347C2B4F|nr:hypothetical protein [Chitinophagaceae bacterium OAS944]